MAIYIRIDGDDFEGELRSLHRWLLDDRYIRRNADVELVTGVPGGDEMGAAVEAIKIAIESGFQIASIALAYAAWRRTRPAKPMVTIERDGGTVTLSGVDSDEVARIVEALESPRS